VVVVEGVEEVVVEVNALIPCVVVVEPVG